MLVYKSPRSEYLLFLLNSVVRVFEEIAESLVQQANFNLTVETDSVTFMGINVCFTICIEVGMIL